MRSPPHEPNQIRSDRWEVRSFACFVKMKEGKEEADEKEGGSYEKYDRPTRWNEWKFGQFFVLCRSTSQCCWRITTKHTLSKCTLTFAWCVPYDIRLPTLILCKTSTIIFTLWRNIASMFFDEYSEVHLYVHSSKQQCIDMHGFPKLNCCANEK